MKSSRAAVDLIVAHEVTSRVVYERKYQRPVWPGVASGVTVGIGYDLGYSSAAAIARDWSGKLHPNTVKAMQKYAGFTRARASSILSEARQKIIVPWDAALAVFMEVSLPKYENMALRACPGSDKLPAGCFGVLASLTYNRGASFTRAGDRYREMRNIRALIMSGDWASVPDEIRSMKRLWDYSKVPGLHRRRDEEAILWKASLDAANVIVVQPEPIPLPESMPDRPDTGDDKSDVITDTGIDTNIDAPTEPHPVVDDNINVQLQTSEYSFEVEIVERQLMELKYFEVGDPTGHYGGKTVAAISAFMTDRGKDPNRGQITQELKDELTKAKREKLPSGEPWSRPISKSRATATAKDIAGKVASINPTWYQKLLAWILGIPAAIGAGIKGIFGEDTTGGYIYQVKSVFSAIPTEFYLLGVVALAVAIFFAAKKASDSTVKDYNEGKIN